MAKESIKLIANNKKAYHDYFIEQTYEAGISLAGTEVKSLRTGKCSIKESYIHIENGEAIIYGMHISPYEKGNIFNKDPLRPRKLLLHRYELNKLMGAITQQGYTIVPLRIYFKGSLAKAEMTRSGIWKEPSGSITAETDTIHGTSHNRPQTIRAGHVCRICDAPV